MLALGIIAGMMGAVVVESACPGNPLPEGTVSVDMAQVLNAIEAHVTTPKTASELITLAEQVQRLIDAGGFGANVKTIERALQVINKVETSDVFDKMRYFEFSKKIEQRSGNEFKWLMERLFQGVFDQAFSDENVQQFPAFFQSKRFEIADYFPGKVTSVVNPSQVFKKTVRASAPKSTNYWAVMHDNMDARRPTGTYLPPGTVGAVRVPQNLVNKGVKVRVGAHSWDLETQRKPRWARLDRVTTLFEITCDLTHIANPLGGGVYIEVPQGLDIGLVDVQIQNVVPAPFFSTKSFDKTDVQQWKTVQTNYGVPFADFESDKFMMQVPTPWLPKAVDPAGMMRDWDLSMDAISELFGFPPVRETGKTVCYLQVDVIYRGSANYPGKFCCVSVAVEQCC